jgi:pyruvate kinase
MPTINRTKIVATIGPASRGPDVLRRLIDAGVDVFRLNFSHGTHEEHSAIVADIRSISRQMERHVGFYRICVGRRCVSTRSPATCWGVTPVVFADAAPPEQMLSQGIDWAKSHGLARSGQHAVLLRGQQLADRSDIRAVLAGAIH